MDHWLSQCQELEKAVDETSSLNQQHDMKQRHLETCLQR